MIAIIALILSILSFLLILIILLKFKSLFSTENILSQARDYMNKMIANIQREANNDMSLINESSKRLRTLLNESDQIMKDFHNATERLRNMIATVSSTENIHENIIKPTKKVVYEHKKLDGVVQKDLNSKKLDEVDPDSSFLIKNIQQSLFDEDSPSDFIKDETMVTPSGAAYKQVPLINSKIFEDELRNNYNGPQIIENIQTQKSKKSLTEKVRNLYAQGVDEENIANQLSCSVTEVQFIIGLL